MAEADTVSFVSPKSHKSFEIKLEPLPEVQQTLATFGAELAPLHCWIKLAKKLYREGFQEKFAEVLEKARDLAYTDYEDWSNDQMVLLDSLAAYYVNLSKREFNREARRELLIRATRLYTAADKIVMLSEDHVLGRAYFCMLEPDRAHQADDQFDFVLNENPNNVLAHIGKAQISFLKGEIQSSLRYYRKALELFPAGLPSVRVGIGLCLFRLGRVGLAMKAFERTLELDPQCVSALTAVALLELNKKSPESIKRGMQLLTKAYSLDSNSPLILNTLADHYFHKGEFTKVERLANSALQRTNNDQVRSFSFFQLGRCYHAKSNFENAYNYYYQSTQVASNRFPLPWFGLGQVYLHRNDLTNAIKCFEKVLEIVPDNLDAARLVSICYLKSDSVEQIEKAKMLYTKVVEKFPEDEESWIGLAEAYNFKQVEKSLEAYQTACRLLTERGRPVYAEIYNNIAAIYFRLEDYSKTKQYLDRALTGIHTQTSPPSLISATISYNLGKTYEKIADLEKAENCYRELLKTFPEYTDCYIRLGYMAKNRGDLRAASEWLNLALRNDPENSEAWLHLANLHLLKKEYGPAQKKFEKVMMANSINYDMYALISVANILLTYLYSSSTSPEEKQKLTERCISLYRASLKVDPFNICAANGIGCVLAYNNKISMARDVFSQCREATADMPNIWINLGHIYVENKQYANAIKMYQNCYDFFYSKNPNIELLLYLARAFYKSRQFKQAKEVVIRGLFYAPRDVLLLFNFSIILLGKACAILKDDKASLKEVQSSISELELSKRNFGYMSTDPEQVRIDKNAANSQQRFCSDLIIQANYRLQRAKQQEEEDAEMVRIHKEHVKEFERMQCLEQEEKLKMQKDKEQELINKRKEFMKNAQTTLLDLPSVEEAKGRAKKSRAASRQNLGEDATAEEPKLAKSKRKKKGQSEKSVDGKRKNYPDTAVDEDKQVGPSKVEELGLQHSDLSDLSEVGSDLNS